MIYFCKKTGEPLTEYDVEFNKILRGNSNYNTFVKAYTLLLDKPMHLLDKRWMKAFHRRYLFAPLIFIFLIIPLVLMIIAFESINFVPVLVNETFRIITLTSLYLPPLVCFYISLFHAWKCTRDFGIDFSKPITKKKYHWYQSETYYKSIIDDDGNVKTTKEKDYDYYTTGGVVRNYKVNVLAFIFLYCTFPFWVLPRYIKLSKTLKEIRNDFFSNELIKAYQTSKKSELRIANSNYVVVLWKELNKLNRTKIRSLKYSYLENKEKKPEKASPIFIRYTNNKEKYYVLYHYEHKIASITEFEEELNKNLKTLKERFLIILNEKNKICVAPYINGEKIFSDNEKDWEKEIELLYGQKQLEEIKTKITLLDLNRAIFI